MPQSREIGADKHVTSTYGFVVTAIDIEPARWDRLAACFGDIEAAGCDAIWLTDHIYSGYPSAEPLVLAAVAATSTSHCLIGTGVLQLPLRRSAVVAKAASTLQLVAGGRFRLGVGVGQHPTEFARVGVDFHRRGALVDQQLEQLATFWQEPEGWYALRPNLAVPIWVGGTSVAALRRVAGFGTGWLALFQSPDRFVASNLRLDDELDAVDRAPESVERHIILLVSPTDSSWSRADALGWAARQFPDGSRGANRYVITGSVASCVDEIREFEQCGAHGIDLQITHPEPIPRFAALCSSLASSRGGSN